MGIDARISVNGTVYEVDPNLTGEAVMLLWGLFDTELYVEFNGERYGPYSPVSGPIPLGRYRAFKKTLNDEKADRIHQLADQLGLPIAALAGHGVEIVPATTRVELPKQPFNADAQEVRFPSTIAAKLAIAADIGMPLAKASEANRAFIDKVLAETLIRKDVLQRVRDYFKQEGEQDAN